MKKTQRNITLGERITGPTPPFFRRIRNFGLIVGAIAGVVVASPTPLPTVVTTVASYLALIASAISAVASLTVDYDQINLPPQKKE